MTMAKLTEPMVIARSKCSDLNVIKKLNCWGNELTDVSLIQKLPNVEVLAFSVNKISSLADFQYCRNLRELYLRKNNIRNLNELCYLQTLPKLRFLTLTENPCTECDSYRLSVLKALPNLEKLDEVEVSEEERRSAMRLGKELIHPDDSQWSDYDPRQQEATTEEPWENPTVMEQEEEEQEFQKISPVRTPENDSPEPESRYQDSEYADRRYSYDQEPTISHRKVSASSYQNYQQQQPQQQQQYSANSTYSPQQSYYNSQEKVTSESPSSPVTPSSLRSPCVEHRCPVVENCQDEEYYRQPRQKYNAALPANGRRKSRSSNILSAVLCLLKELDYQSLEVVDTTVNARMNELMHEHQA